MNRFDEWLDIREVKEILIIETENIQTPGGRINIYLVVFSLGGLSEAREGSGILLVVEISAYTKCPRPRI